MKIRFVAVSLLTLALCACSDNKPAETAPTVEVVNIPAAPVETVVCTTDFTPVCGTDGMTYSNACQAGVAGVGIAEQGACVVPTPSAVDAPMAPPAPPAPPMAPPPAAPAPMAPPAAPEAAPAPASA